MGSDNTGSVGHDPPNPHDPDGFGMGSDNTGSVGHDPPNPHDPDGFGMGSTAPALTHCTPCPDQYRS